MGPGAWLRACMVWPRAWLVRLRACMVGLRAWLVRVRACMVWLRACMVWLRAWLVGLMLSRVHSDREARRWGGRVVAQRGWPWGRGVPEMRRREAC